MLRFHANLDLLPRDALCKTGDVDHADWNYRPFLGLIQRQRFKLICSLRGQEKYDRLLEVGYDSGVFMPHLSRSCRQLYGIDVHGQHEQVTDTLKRRGIEATLISQSAESMPFADQFFDCIVAVSAIEFIDHLESGCQEMARVLKPKGSRWQSRPVPCSSLILV